MTAREKVSILLDVETAQAIGAWLQNNRAIVMNEESLQKLEGASKRASRTSKEGFDLANTAVGNVMRQVTGLIAGMASVHTATALFRKELEAVDRVRQKALDFQLDAATAQRQALTALGSRGDISQEELIRRIEAQTNIPIAQQYLVATSAISGAGSLGASRAVDTAIAAGEFAPHLQAEELRQVTSGALELQKSFPEYAPRQAISQVLAWAGPARQEDIGKLSKNIIPAVGQARAWFQGNADAQTLFSFFNAIAQRSGDVEGAVSRTGGMSFLRQMTTEGVGRGLFDLGASPDEMFAALQADTEEAKALRRKLLGPLEVSFREAKRKGDAADPKLRSEAQTYIALAEMFDPTSQTFQLFQQGRQGGTPEQVLAEQEAFVRKIEAQPLQQAFRAKRSIDVGLEKLRSDPSRALGSLRRNELAELLVESGYSATMAEAESFVGAAISGGGTPTEQLDKIIRPLRDRETGLRDVRAIRGRGFGESEQAFGRREQAAIAERSRLADALDAVADLLEEQRDLLKEQNHMMQQPQKVELPANAQPARPGAAALNEGG